MQNNTTSKKTIMFNEEQIVFLGRFLPKADFWKDRDLSALTHVEASSLIIQISDAFSKNKAELSQYTDYESFIACTRRLIFIFNATPKVQKQPHSIKDQINEMDLSFISHMEKEKERLAFLLGESISKHFSEETSAKLVEASITELTDLYLVLSEFSPLGSDYSGMIYFFRNMKICTEEEIKYIVSKMQTLGFNANNNPLFASSFMMNAKRHNAEKRPIEIKLDEYKGYKK